MFPALLPNFVRADLAFAHGDGAYLWTEDGRKFLDFGAGIATSSIGHAHPHLVETIARRASMVMHVSNIYRVPQAERLAQRLVDRSFADSVFFCNSGAEANEGMIATMRNAMSATGRGERIRLICFDGAFHGRTLGTLAAGSNAQYRKGFGPVPAGFDRAPLNNINAVRDTIGPETCGIIVEPIQGDGGVRQADLQFLRDLRAVCDECGILLGLDEVQTGMGRTGKLFAHEWAGIEPDVMALAKGIGGGFPLGAVLAKADTAKHLTPGTHGTTFGGNPLACAAGNAVLDVIGAPGFLDHVVRRGQRLRAGLETVARENPAVFSAVRGDGLLLGLQCVPPQADVQNACMAEGLLALPASENVLRLSPPLIVTDAQCDAACAAIGRAAARLMSACGPSTR
ncbi:MAG: aspartate aminotransferase family protein [Rhodospirillales bacterium]